MSLFSKPLPFKHIISPLTLRLLIINVITILVLIGGVFFLGIYKEELLQTERDDLEMDTFTMVSFIESAMIDFDQKTDRDILNIPLIKKMFKRLKHRVDTHIYIFDAQENLLADNLSTISQTYAKQHFDQFHDGKNMINDLSGPLNKALTSGSFINTSWNEGSESDLILNTTIPIKNLKGDILGGVSISRLNIFKDTVRNARLRFLVICFISLSLTTFLSIYLAQTITKPIARLARSAHNVKQHHKQSLDDATLDSRTDEIGDLYRSLESMTQALFNRMGAIESFAADVSHEIKNPLASIQSAIESISKVKSEKDKTKLLNIITSDVARLDRLISDISNASRVDAEMSRIDFTQINLANFLEAIIGIYNDTIQQDATPIEFINQTKGKTFIQGNESRLSQVIQNLLGNALSFSNENDPIKIFLSREGDQLKISVENIGPAIPEKKLEKIFERFYSDRPHDKAQHHMDLNHSGLGLSISKQIIDAHHGKIWAENLKNNKGETVGARFIILL